MAGRIGIVSAFALPHLGGIEQFTDNLARELVSRGHPVSVITCDFAGLGEYEMLPSGVEVFRLPCVTLAGDRFPLVRKDARFRRMDALLASEEYEGILVNTRFFSTTPYALDLGGRAGVRPFVLDHGSAYIGFGSPAIDWAVRLYEHGMTWRAKRREPDFYGVSQKSVEWLRHFGIEACGAINNAVDAAGFVAQASGRAFREELGLGPDAMVVAFTGRLLSSKGVWHVIDVARALHERGANVWFAVAGDGPELERLQAAAPPNVAFVGRLEKPDVAALLLQSDLFLFPSEYPEGMPSSVLEAAACGLSTIGTDVGGMREILPSDEYGVVYERFDAEDCVRRIEGMLEGREALKEAGERCRQRVERKFSWKRTADAVLAACERAKRGADVS
jgi:glycosyltransferase involved in cell wall biosynthesis